MPPLIGGDIDEKKALVLGAGGFIAHHLQRRLKKENYWVRSVDLGWSTFR